jgi:hypothetical protein
VSILIVANDPKEWPIQIPNVEVIEPRLYLTRPEYSQMRGVKLFNLCRSYRYQSNGYYVSLLAEARGHKPMPSITTIQDMKSQAMVRLVSDDLDELIQHSLAPIQSPTFVLSIYFGRNMAKRYDRLCLNLFNLFESPMLRATFSKNGKWSLRSINTIAASDVPESHWPFVMQVATEHFAGRRIRTRRRARTRYHLAMLVNPKETDPPSNERALQRFTKTAESLGIETERVGRDDYARIAEFDALFIRETTAVNHHTYKFSRRAAGEGLVVIDDPKSIVRCSNKVFLAESMALNAVPTPKTIVVHKGNVDSIADELGLPCVLKCSKSRTARFRLASSRPRRAKSWMRSCGDFSTTPIWLWPRSSCPRLSIGESASSPGGLSTPANTSWPPSTGKSSSATARAPGSSAASRPSRSSSLRPKRSGPPSERQT